MAITKTLTGSIVVLDLNADGTLRASNVTRHYVLADGGVELARPVERDVLTAETVSAVLPDQAALVLRVQELEADLSALSSVAKQRDDLGGQLAAAEAARATALAELAASEHALAIKQASLSEALARVEALQSEKEAAAAKARMSVSPAAARVVLRNAGLLTAVEAAVEAADPHSDLRIFWEYSEAWRRESPFITQMGAALGLTNEQIDNLFSQAATL